MVEPTVSSSATLAGEPHFIDYLRVIRRRRWLIFGVTGCVAVLALLATFALPRQYRSSATLLVSAPKLGDGAPVSSVAVATYRGILQNPSLTAEVLSDLGLDKPPQRLDPQTFVGTSVLIEEVPAASLLVVHVTMRDPAIAAQIANRIGDAAVKLNQRLIQTESQSASGDIHSQVVEAQAKLDEAYKHFVDVMSTAQIDLRRRDAEILLNERAELRALNLDIAAERARVDRAEKELASRERILDFPRTSGAQGGLLTSSIDQANSTERGDSKTGDAEYPVPPAFDARSPFINPVYEALEFQVASGRTRLAALERRRSELTERQGLNGQQIPQLSELYERESQLARLELEVDLARNTYEDLASRYDQARLQVANRTTQLQVIGRAVPATRPSSPRVVRTVAAATLLALVASLLLSFLMEYISAVRFAERKPPS